MAARTTQSKSSTKTAVTGQYAKTSAASSIVSAKRSLHRADISIARARAVERAAGLRP